MLYGAVSSHTCHPFFVKPKETSGARSATGLRTLLSRGALNVYVCNHAPPSSQCIIDSFVTLGVVFPPVQPFWLQNALTSNSAAVGRFSCSISKVRSRNSFASGLQPSGRSGRALVVLPAPLPPILKIACNCVNWGVGGFQSSFPRSDSRGTRCLPSWCTLFGERLREPSRRQSLAKRHVDLRV